MLTASGHVVSRTTVSDNECTLCNSTSHEKSHHPPAGFKMRRSCEDRLWRYRERVRLSLKMENLPKTQSNVAVSGVIQLQRVKAATVVEFHHRVCGDLQ